MRHKSIRGFALLLALLIGLAQCSGALAYAGGVWPGGYDAPGCTSRDAQIRNDGKHFFNCNDFAEPWCEDAGYATFQCVYCGETRTEYYPALGHIWSDWYMMDETSCEENGVEARYCARCQAQETRSTPPRGHDWGEWDPISPPTCTEPGEQIRYCGRCFEEQTQSIPALGHDWGSWETEQAATCTMTGIDFRYCKNCWAEEFRTTQPLGHNWLEWQTVRAATCTSPGLQRRYCSRCQTDETRETSPLNHTWGNWRTEIPGNCAEKEMKVRACVNCGEEEYRYFDFGDHVWGEWYTVKEPTGTETGIEECVCQIDPSHVEEREIQPGSSWAPIPPVTPLPDPGVPDSGPTPGTVPAPVPAPQDEAELSVTVDVQQGDPPYAPKTDFEDGEEYWFHVFVTNVGKVEIELYDVEHSTSGGYSSKDSKPGSRYLLKPGETVDSWNGAYFAGVSGTVRPNKVAPGTETETLAGTINYTITVPGYKPGTDEVICTATGSASLGVLKDSGKEQDHSVTFVASWEEGVGEGKRYEGAVIPLYLSCTNTGSVPVRSGDDVYQPGESDNSTYEWIVTAAEAEAGVVHTGFTHWVYVYEYQDAEGNWIRDVEDSNDVVIPLTYPDGEEPEKKKPELNLTYLYDNPAKDVYDPEDAVFARYSLVNTGNVPLKVVAHFTSDGVTDYDMDWGYFDPGQSETNGWGWFRIKDGVAPGTETEDLLGTVTIHYYYRGLDPDTEEELCRTQTISRAWKAAKPQEGPAPWVIPEESDITAVHEIAPGYESSDPAGYQLGERYRTQLIVTNTGSVDIPVYSAYCVPCGEEHNFEDLAVTESINLFGFWYSDQVTEEDAERGYIYCPPVPITWIDPDSGNEKIAYSNDLTLKVTGRTGLLVQKGIARLPANGTYFAEGEQVEWVIQVTNTSDLPITNVTVTDQGKTAGAFAEIAPGQTVECFMYYTVTEFDTMTGYVTNVAEAAGTDFRGAGHIWPSNSVTVPASPTSPVPVPVPIPKPGDPDTKKNKDEDPGTPKPGPGKPETPTTPGSPGGGEDPKGPIYGYKAAATLYKTTAHGPKNWEYYELNETVDYDIILTNTGEVPLEDIVVYDSLAGFAPIATAASLAPGDFVTFSYPYTITQADIDGAGYVVNSAIVAYTFGGGIPGTPVNSNPVYVIAGKDGKIPDPGKPGGGTDGGNTGGTPVTSGLIPPVHFDPDKLHGTPGGGEGPVSCELQMNAMSGSGANYTLHACAAHTAAAQNAQAASAAGDWKKAADIWRAEIEALYELLYEAGDSEGKAAALNDRAAFEAYVNAFQAVYGDETTAGLLRLRCAELCCMIKTAPERLPDSILGDYAHLMITPDEKCGREFGPLDGSDTEMTERFDAVHGAELEEVIRLARTAKYGPAQQNAFTEAQRRWQMALDSVVNARYRAADREIRKLIAASRTALDNVYAARKTLLDMLYAGAPEEAAEALSSLYKDALIDACGK